MEDTDIWETSCSNMHEFIDGDPEDNNHKFCPYCGGELRMWHPFTKEELAAKLVVGAKVKLGWYYLSHIEDDNFDEVITLEKGTFDFDNGLYTEYQSAPSIWDKRLNEFCSIFHLFGNELEHFYDCEVIEGESE